MKYNIKCCECKETMSITFKNILKRDSLKCFNCESEMSKELLADLQGIAEHHLSANQHIKTTSEIGETLYTWDFSISQ